jgi:hypothetical protein
MKALLAIALTTALLAAAGAASARQSSVTIAVVPAAPAYGDTVTFDVAGDAGGGYVTTRCIQAGTTHALGSSWWYPYYGYHAETILAWSPNAPGSPISCTSTFDDVTGIKGNAPASCWAIYPPPYSCMRTRSIVSTEYAVAP